jgi:hypothetical protein
MDFIIAVVVGAAGLWAWQKWGHIVMAKIKGNDLSGGTGLGGGAKDTTNEDKH